MKKFYLGLEERYSMSGQLVSAIFLLAERSTSNDPRAVSERMSVVTQYGYFEAEVEFRFSNESNFKVISKIDGNEIGTGVCSGPFDEPKSMIDTIRIQQTKEKATAVFSFDGPRIFVAKTYSSLDSGEQTGFSVEKLMEIAEGEYNSLRNKSEEITKRAKEIRFNI